LNTENSSEQYGGGGGPIGTFTINLDAKAKYNFKNDNLKGKKVGEEQIIQNHQSTLNECWGGNISENKFDTNISSTDYDEMNDLHNNFNEEFNLQDNVNIETCLEENLEINDSSIIESQIGKSEDHKYCLFTRATRDIFHQFHSLSLPKNHVSTMKIFHLVQLSTWICNEEDYNNVVEVLINKGIEDLSEHQYFNRTY